MKKIIISALITVVFTSTHSFAATSLIVHSDCAFKNNTLSIKNSDGTSAENSPEVLMENKGYTLVTSSDHNDTLSDLIQLSFAEFPISDQPTVSLQIQDKSGIQVFVAAGKDLSQAIKNLPNCQKY